jgi:hypothetical protein
LTRRAEDWFDLGEDDYIRLVQQREQVSRFLASREQLCQHRVNYLRGERK